MDVIADLPADPYPAEPVKMGEGALNDTVLGTEPGAVLGTAAGRSRPAARAGSAAPALMLNRKAERSTHPPEQCSGERHAGGRPEREDDDSGGGEGGGRSQDGDPSEPFEDRWPKPAAGRERGQDEAYASVPIVAVTWWRSMTETRR